MGLTIRKVFSEDVPKVKNLLKKGNQLPITDDRVEKLFTKQWICEEQDYGLLAEDNGRIVAFLGVIYSKRFWNERYYKVANLTTFFVDPHFRGQQITYKMVTELQKIDDYVIFAVTPIAGTYNVYLKNGFQEMEINRFLFWRFDILSRIKKSRTVELVINDKKKILGQLSDENLKLFLDHQAFACKHVVIKTKEGSVYLILKSRSFSIRKLFNYNLIGYFAKITGIFTGSNFSQNIIHVDEIYFASDYELLGQYFNEFQVLYFRNNSSINALSIRKDLCEFHRIKSKLKTEFQVPMHFFYGNDLDKTHVDLLYSEIFVLNM